MEPLAARFSAILFVKKRVYADFFFNFFCFFNYFCLWLFLVLITLCVHSENVYSKDLIYPVKFYYRITNFVQSEVSLREYYQCFSLLVRIPIFTCMAFKNTHMLMQ